MGKAMQTFNSNPPQNHLDETTLPSGHQWETMNNAKKRKFISGECFVHIKFVEDHC
jgi:hypothetical protein